jgi:hypothetical protein
MTINTGKIGSCVIGGAGVLCVYFGAASSNFTNGETVIFLTLCGYMILWGLY